MKPAVLLAALALWGCAAPLRITPQELKPVSSGERMELARAAKVIEQRAVKVEWLLLPGQYVERYASPAGRVFVSEGRLVQFTPTVGEKQFSVGGFIISREQPAIARLFTVPGTAEFAAYARQEPVPARALEGALRVITDFPRAELR